MIKILYEDNHLIAVLKQINIPTQQDSSRDLDMLTMTKQYLKEKYNKSGDVYLGLLHRLDRPVSGVMIFAKTSKAANRLSKQIKNHSVKKIYYAIVEGRIDNSGVMEDNLLKDSKTNMVKIDEKGKRSILEYELIKYKNNFSLVRVQLITGRSHQIRVQFSSRNHPLYGDQRYNKQDKKQIALFCQTIELEHPTLKKRLTISDSLPDYYPWNMF